MTASQDFRHYCQQRWQRRYRLLLLCWGCGILGTIGLWQHWYLGGVSLVGLGMMSGVLYYLDRLTVGKRQQKLWTEYVHDIYQSLWLPCHEYIQETRQVLHNYRTLYDDLTMEMVEAGYLSSLFDWHTGQEASILLNYSRQVDQTRVGLSQQLEQMEAGIEIAEATLLDLGTTLAEEVAGIPDLSVVDEHLRTARSRISHVTQQLQHLTAELSAPALPQELPQWRLL